jgi:hypothetical protein
MQMSSDTTYTNITQAQYDAFRYQARAKGLNITSGSGAETVEFDKVPVAFNYNPDTQILSISVGEPHWLTPGVTVGVLHSMLAFAMLNKDAVKGTSQSQYLKTKTPQSIDGNVLDESGTVRDQSQDKYQQTKEPQPIAGSVLAGKSGKLRIVTTALPASVVKTAYTQTVLANGGVLPYSFAVTKGSLPTGLSLSKGGVISGTATQPLTPSWAYTVTVTDSSSPAQTADQEYSY